MNDTQKVQSDQPKINLTDVVREYFPEVDDDLAGYILWNETAFPFCGAANNAEYIRLQLARLKCREEFLCGGPFRTPEQDMDLMAAEERGDA